MAQSKRSSAEQLDGTNLRRRLRRYTTAEPDSAAAGQPVQAFWVVGPAHLLFRKSSADKYFKKNTHQHLYDQNVMV